MVGLSGLKKKTEEISEQDQLVENFISGAEKRVKDLEVSQKKFVRCTFSLNEELSQLIDDLIVKSNNARVNRSSIVRIALESLAEQTPEEFQELINKNSK
ncbi:hypothetical protein [Acinetobacter sp. MB5]|uniref:hypothetical protein n=1 Tax=Acinetobacter sp. MB5 TaxID=2069438 RepID=UPI000DCFE327|nr:hypothetical protein [Acinetobacter sp. MB5]